MRQWRHEWTSVEPPPATHASESKANSRWAYELPFGMPKDWQLLPPHTQDLLRAARSGVLYKRRAPVEEEEADADGAAVAASASSAASGGGADHGAASANGSSNGFAAGAAATASSGAQATSGAAPAAGDKRKTPHGANAGAGAGASGAPLSKEGGYTIKVWKQMPRDVESPMPTYLAKRRKNTIVLPPKQTTSQNSTTSLSMPMVTVAKVRRLDAAGNPYEQSVTLADGQKLADGDEILSTRLVPAVSRDLPPPPQQTTPSRKRNPPPRRKGKVGRGRKKGVLPVGLQRSRAAAAAAAAAAASAATSAALDGSTPAPAENGEAAAAAPAEGEAAAAPTLPGQLPLPDVSTDAQPLEPADVTEPSEEPVAPKEESVPPVAVEPKEEPTDVVMADVPAPADDTVGKTQSA